MFRFSSYSCVYFIFSSSPLGWLIFYPLVFFSHCVVLSSCMSFFCFVSFISPLRYCLSSLLPLLFIFSMSFFGMFPVCPDFPRFLVLFVFFFLFSLVMYFLPSVFSFPFSFSYAFLAPSYFFSSLSISPFFFLVLFIFPPPFSHFLSLLLFCFPCSVLLSLMFLSPLSIFSFFSTGLLCSLCLSFSSSFSRVFRFVMFFLCHNFPCSSAIYLFILLSFCLVLFCYLFRPFSHDLLLLCCPLHIPIFLVFLSFLVISLLFRRSFLLCLFFSVLMTFCCWFILSMSCFPYVLPSLCFLFPLFASFFFPRTSFSHFPVLSFFLCLPISIKGFGVRNTGIFSYSSIASSFSAVLYSWIRNTKEGKYQRWNMLSKSFQVSFSPYFRIYV